MIRITDFDDIRPGDSVTIRLAGGACRRGRAVSYSRLHGSWTVLTETGDLLIALEGNFVSGSKILKEA